MRYKSDWEMAKKRFAAFWNQEIEDRCCISVKAETPYEDPLRDLLYGDEAARLQYWTDPETIIRRSRNQMAHTYYGGEAFPAIFINLGAGGHAGFFKGAKPVFSSNSVWFLPSLSDPEDLEFDENSFLYRKTIEMAKAYAEDSRGDYMVAMPDTSGNIDVLSHLMSPEELLPWMIETRRPFSGP